MHYRPDIDGLRGIAVLAVVVHHAFPGLLPGGFVGVDIFFVISGYLITRDIVERQAAGTFSLADFYRRRVRRIFPALLVVLVATLLFGGLVLFPDELGRLFRHTAASALFGQNILLMSEVGYFDADAATKPLLHLWSLSVEEQFYVLWPLALMAGLRWRATVALIVASYAVMVWLVLESPAVAYYMPLARFWQILAGAALAMRPVNAPAWLGLPLCIAAIGLGLPEAATMPLTSAAATAGAFFLIATPNRWLQARWLVWVGLISYPLYLWHWPILAFLRIFGESRELPTIAAVLLAFVLAAWTYKFVERPIRAQVRVVRPLFAGLATLAAASVVVASTGLRADHRFADMRYEPPAGQKCDERFVAERQYCVTDGSRYLLFGDSHAEALFIGMRGIQPHQWTSISRYGCAPGHAAGKKQSRPCSSIDKVLLEIQRSDFEVVVLAFRDFYPTLPQEIGKTVQALKGKRVIVLTSVPDLPFHPRECVARPLQRQIDCSFARVDAEAKQATLRAAVIASGAELVNVLDVLCNGPRCNVDRGEMLMYRDVDHLSARGASLMARHVIRAMEH
jgi:peptidoglycan/LPS O-acetylase OafA/YrhL